ncbi:hypothetical protein HDK77DRAFT_489035 [Phyllosticta capitalensis]|uniref:uncharacterized protein n=1 Tax=Phyllosticta capitalensis TaxID=121624 RepID=UPI00312CC3A1
MTTENRRVLGDISNAPPPVPAIDLTGKAPNPPAKRPAPQDEPSGEEDDRPLWCIIEDRSMEGVDLDKDCNQVRRMIHRLIDNGAMKIGEFCNIINQGLKLPTAGSKKQKTNSKEATPQASNDDKQTKTAKTKKESGAITAAHLADIKLPKEDVDDVEVYDSCDEIRKKINAHLRVPGVTQAQFCRDLAAQLHTPAKPTNIQSRQLTAFRDKKGPDAGNTSVVYYAAYIFFEKIRIKDGKPKSSHRLGMEKTWVGGMDIKRPAHKRSVWVGPNVKSVRQDQFGKFSVTY